MNSTVQVQDAAAGDTRRAGRWLGRLLIAAAAVSVLLSSSFVLFWIPAARSDTKRSDALQSGVSQVQYLISGEANDERGFLISRDPVFLSEFAVKQQHIDQQLAMVLAGSSPAARRAMADGVPSYRSFLADHREVVASAQRGDWAGATALAMGPRA